MTRSKLRGSSSRRYSRCFCFTLVSPSFLTGRTSWGSEFPGVLVVGGSEVRGSFQEDLEVSEVSQIHPWWSIT